MLPSAARGPRGLIESERWFLVRSQLNSERKALWHLRAQGFSTFLPQFQKTTRHARKLKTVKAPLFPGYLFVVIDLKRDPWHCIRSTIGVSHLHAHRDDTPVPVPCGIVERLIEQSDGDIIRLDRGLCRGQNVRILSGPFADLVGILERLDGAGRVQVLIKMMGSAVAVALDRSALAPAA